MTRVFDGIADEYDRWYNTPEGAAIFREEVECLRLLQQGRPGRWLEVGVGTGRFAYTLGIAEGVDPSPRMLEMAAGRDIATHEARAEDLPFQRSSFDGVLMALTLCFIGSAEAALKECQRILRPLGCLLIGTVAADGPWGREYVEKAHRGHPVYALAHFRTGAETVELVENAGFTLTRAASALFWRPGDAPPEKPRVEPGIFTEAGFLGLLFERTARGHPSAAKLKAQE
ncbi:methyltransferase domain-containing protein [Candidatus Sumerlaeota bacterium]|nr:methyltransferase domain-containing protein [Candidatus Sumerlaeota bacterium]